MNDALGMRSIQRLGDLYAKLQHSGDVQPLRGYHLFQRAAFQELHGDEGGALGFINVMDRADVRMIESRCRPSLAPQTFQRLRRLRQFIGKKFKRHDSPQPQVLGLIHNSHAAAAQSLEDPVMRDGGPDELGGRRHEREMLALASLEVAGKDEKRKDEGPDENRVAAQPGRTAIQVLSWIIDALKAEHERLSCDWGS